MSTVPFTLAPQHNANVRSPCSQARIYLHVVGSDVNKDLNPEVKDLTKKTIGIKFGER